MEKKTETLNIYQKLLTIQQRINGLGKDKQAFGYKYVTGDKLLSEVKPMMNELGLLLKQEILSIDNCRQDYATKSGSKSEILSKVMVRFTWIDCSTGEKDENLFGANGQNDWDKGVGSALTYSERYFLLKYFHIATDEDDIDNPERKDEAKIAAPAKPAENVAKAEPVTPVVLPVLEKGSDKYLKIVEGLADGMATMERVKMKNDVSPEIEKAIEKEVKAIQASRLVKA